VREGERRRSSAGREKEEDARVKRIGRRGRRDFFPGAQRRQKSAPVAAVGIGLATGYSLFLFPFFNKNIFESRFLALYTGRHATQIPISFSGFGESNYLTIAYIRRFGSG
jgi:hypothetical protein